MEPMTVCILDFFLQKWSQNNASQRYPDEKYKLLLFLLRGIHPLKDKDLVIKQQNNSSSLETLTTEFCGQKGYEKCKMRGVLVSDK